MRISECKTKNNMGQIVTHRSQSIQPCGIIIDGVISRLIGLAFFC
jgi:hypothetical protein